MRHQWDSKQIDRLNFDDFGQWYNDGGYERAPWLELLDLKKWVLGEDSEDAIDSSSNAIASPRPSPRPMRSPRRSPRATTNNKDAKDIPPAPEEDLDDSFFDDNHIMAMDSVSCPNRL